MLSFELKPPTSQSQPTELEVYCDYEGLEGLIAMLQMLKDRRTDHVHLMAYEWGGMDLDDTPQNASNLPIRHVKILVRDDKDMVSS